MVGSGPVPQGGLKGLGRDVMDSVLVYLVNYVPKHTVFT